MLIPFGILSAAGVSAAPTDSYDLISTTILGSGANSVTFTSLGDYASTYKHLQLRFMARISENISGGVGTFYFNLNGDTAANYSRHILKGNGSSVSSSALTSTSTPDFGQTTGNTAGANIFAAGVADFLDVFSTTKYKTTRTFCGNELYSGNWRSTSSVTSIALETYGDHQFVTGTRFSLYGIKG